MGRNLPRYLYCETANTKSEGPFIIHTIPPKFVVKPLFDERRSINGFSMVESWDDVEIADRWKIQDDMRRWFDFNGRRFSTHPKDRMLVALGELPFWKDGEHDYTLEQVVEVARVCFPGRTKAINDSHTSYGIKHMMERISRTFVRSDEKKYCSNDMLKEAFEILGFRASYPAHSQQNCNYNIAERDVTTLRELFKEQ